MKMKRNLRKIICGLFMAAGLTVSLAAADSFMIVEAAPVAAQVVGNVDPADSSDFVELSEEDRIFLQELENKEKTE